MPRWDGKPTYEELEAENARLRDRVDELEAKLERALGRIEELEKKVEEAQRAKKRQAAPFSKGEPKESPEKPGRKPDEEYGEQCRREPPDPDELDEVIHVHPDGCCPDCGGAVAESGRVESQYQTDIPPVEPFIRQFQIHFGTCSGCGKSVQPRHPEQTSDALGAAGAQLGPNVLALGTQLNKEYGLSWGKVRDFVEGAFGIDAARSTFCRAAQRIAGRLRETHEAMSEHVANAPVVYGDETGWTIDGKKAWLWTFVSDLVTVYRIAYSRGQDVIKHVLGREYAGTIGRDGWAPYRCLTEATHQTCLAHLLRRCDHILETAKRGAARFAHGIKRCLQALLSLRDRRDELDEATFETQRAEWTETLDWYLGWEPSYEPNARFVKHLRNERPHLLTFLDDPAVEATNWPAEQAIRPAVVNRKMSAGNRSDRGARVQAILTSFFRTCHQLGREAHDLIVGALRAPEPPGDLLGLANLSLPTSQ